MEANHGAGALGVQEGSYPARAGDRRSIVGSDGHGKTNESACQRLVEEPEKTVARRAAVRSTHAPAGPAGAA